MRTSLGIGCLGTADCFSLFKNYQTAVPTATTPRVPSTVFINLPYIN
jgi:hypothetical protein